MATRRLFYSLILIALLAGCNGKPAQPPAAAATPAQVAVVAPAVAPTLAPTATPAVIPTAKRITITTSQSA
jgi:hypothetical protein